MKTQTKKQGLREIKRNELARKIKIFLIDTIANITFWHIIFGICEVLIFGYTLSQMINARIGNFLLSLLLGGFYGQAINLGRYLLNKKHYDETKGKKRKIKNWKTHVHDTIVDGISTTIFWNIIFAFWLKYVSKLAWTQIFWATIGYTILYILFGGIYGKYLDWWRRKI